MRGFTTIVKPVLRSPSPISITLASCWPGPGKYQTFASVLDAVRTNVPSQPSSPVVGYESVIFRDDWRILRRSSTMYFTARRRNLHK